MRAHDKHLRLLTVSIMHQQRLLKDGSKDEQQKRTKIHKDGGQKYALQTLNLISDISPSFAQFKNIIL